MSEIKYPSADDYLAIIDAAGEGLVRSHLAQEGVYPSGRAEQWAPLIARIRFERSWYRRLSRAIYRKSAGYTFVALRMRGVSLAAACEALCDKERTTFDVARRPELLNSLQRGEGRRVLVSYARVRPQRAEWLRREPRQFAVDVVAADGMVDLRASLESASDAAVARDVMRAMAALCAATPVHLENRDLSVSAKTVFFDRLRHLVATDAAGVVGVTGATISFPRKKAKADPAATSEDDEDEQFGEGEDEDEDERDDGLASDDDHGTEDMELPPELVGRIEQAVLTGTNLREHEGVKTLLGENGYFSSMTFTFPQKGDPKVAIITVRVAFKTRPEVFEIWVGTSAFGTGESAEISETDEDVAEAVATRFWRAAHAALEAVRAEGSIDDLVS
jgi:hypothetical protein